ncbi:MAG: LysR family transcriptional regulator [Candidatus Obscuribacterales bacterium]|nr:LysR family transcriptional regulator [Candidatus Obscuribacterales bacterium]
MVQSKSLNLDSLRSFVIFADKLNFTHAAEVLHISQPALYMKVSELADSLGVPLYRKVGRRLELTQQGKHVARFGRQISDTTNAFLDELFLGMGKQPVILAAGEGAFLYMLGGAIREFVTKSEFPLQVKTLNREGVIDAVSNGTAHIGVAPLATPLPAGFDSTLLRKADQMLVMPRTHPLADKLRVQLRDLEGCKLILPPGDRPHRQQLSAQLQSAGINWEVAVEASGWELMLHFARLGLGLTVVNSICTIPKGLVAKKLHGLPSVHYYLFHLSVMAKIGSHAILKKMIIAAQ